jgi:hypothetical protein
VRNAYCSGVLCWMAGDGASFGRGGKVEARGDLGRRADCKMRVPLKERGVAGWMEAPVQRREL